MVATIAPPPPGSTVVRRAEALSNNRDGRSGHGGSHDEPDGTDDFQSHDEAAGDEACGPHSGLTGAPAGGLTVEGLLALQEQGANVSAEDDRAAGARLLAAKSLY